MTPIGMRIVFGAPLQPRIFVAATLGVTGVALLFLPELREAGQGGSVAFGIALVLAAVVACAAGNLIAVRNHNAGIPTIPGTAWAMAYGTAFAALVAIANGAPWTFDARPRYVLSLAYLAVFGSVVAFVTYFTLLKRVGAGPSSYIAVATPVIALMVSTLLEGYRWTPVAGIGVALAVLGNWLALRPVPGTAARREGEPTATRASRRR
jgi:drug/metabolite transporter (DMT)-like permease